jgi:hypothetical protein
MKITTVSINLVRLLILAAVFVGIPANAWAQTPSNTWSTVGSTGEADDTAQISYDGPTAFLASGSGVPHTTLIRYQITPVDGLFFNGCKALKVRFRDEGSAASVKVALKRTNIDTGGTVNMIVFNSDLSAPAAGFQNQVTGCRVFNFNFSLYSYWLEASLSKTQQSASPAIQLIQIVSTD